MPQVRVLFVCLGNICRSPTAEGVMRKLVEEAGLADTIAIDSAGTGAHHAGELPDPRTRSAAARRGLSLTHRARGVTADDFDSFDYLLAMDLNNLDALRRRAPRGGAAHMTLLRSFDPDSPEGAEVPDPYYGGARGFEDVLDLVERACIGLLEALVARHGLRRGPIHSAREKVSSST
jgi:protein-tyrosine phosphatase